jgi:MSHA pilin protein MshD
MCPRAHSQGISLIEVVVFIVVVSIGLVSLFMLHSSTARMTVDPLVRHQALALANAFMEEIQLRGFTYCDPNDANVYTATSATVGPNGCANAATVEALGLEAGESYAPRSSLDNVNDYQKVPGPDLTMSGIGITDITGAAISATGGLNGYTVSINVANIAAAELPQVSDTNDALRITVTVTGPAGVNLSLRSYRLRYAPNSP